MTIIASVLNKLPDRLDTICEKEQQEAHALVGETEEQLQKLITYHLKAGNFSSADACSKKLLDLAERGLIAAIVAIIGCMVPTSVQGQNEYISEWHPDSDTPALRKLVVNELQTIPVSIRDSAFRAGLRVVIVPMVSEYLDMHNSDRPRGYVNGGGYDNTDALFNPSKNELLVAERVSYHNGAPRPTTRVPYLIHHEFGHAYDYYLGHQYSQLYNITKTPRFIQTYGQELQRLSLSQREKIAYFCQSDGAGASETFAELFGMHFTPVSAWSNKEADQALLRAFPLTNLLVTTTETSPETLASWSN